MSKKERTRKGLLEAVSQGYLTLKEASQRLELSYRQGKRVYRRYREGGDEGLVHRRRGKRSNRAYEEEWKQRVLLHYQEAYEGFGPTLASEKLEQHGYELHPDTLRKWLLAAGLWAPMRKQRRHRQRRERRKQFGALVQMDGSIHRWFETEAYAFLMNCVDDATGTTLAWMAKGETTQAAMTILKQWIERYGIPKALYVDLKNMYVGQIKLSDEALMHREESFSVFAAACQRLGIAIIKAYSAQAKGRVERSHQVYQDRLVKEIRLRGLTTVEEVNALLQEGFVDDLNRRFAKAPADPQDAHRPLPQEGDLNAIFYWEATRQVQNDWTLRYHNQWYQIAKTTPLRVKPKAKVTIKTHLDGRLSWWYKEHPLRVECLGADKPGREKPEKGGLSELERSAISRKNALASPWRGFNPGWLASGNRMARNT